MGESKEPDSQYTADFQMLCALITHLGTHERWQSRSASQVAGSLAMPVDEVERVLVSYPAFFRESTNRNAQGERLFTVHLRYARRVIDPTTKSHVALPLTPQEAGMLIGTVMQMVSIESQESHFVRDLRASNKRHAVTTLVAVLVALMSAAATIVVALMKLAGAS